MSDRLHMKTSIRFFKLAFRNLNVDHVVLCVFGQVEQELRISFLKLVSPLFTSKSDFSLIFVPQEPRMILQTDDPKKMVDKEVVMHLMRKLVSDLEPSR